MGALRGLIADAALPFRSCSGSAPTVVTLTALESIASWERISVAEAAAKLLALDEDGRFQVQQEYAMVHRR